MKASEFVRYAKEIVSSGYFPVSKEKFSGGQADFVLDNINWLVEWFKNPKEEADPQPKRMEMQDAVGLIVSPMMSSATAEVKTTHLQMQIFRNSFSYADVYDGGEFESIRYEHAVSILRSAIFGTKELNAHAEGSRYGGPPNTMSGLCEQKGRMPTPADNCRFIYLAGNGITRWFEIHEYNSRVRYDRPSHFDKEQDPNDYDKIDIISECCLEIF